MELISTGTGGPLFAIPERPAPSRVERRQPRPSRRRRLLDELGGTVAGGAIGQINARGVSHLLNSGGSILPPGQDEVVAQPTSVQDKLPCETRNGRIKRCSCPFNAQPAMGSMIQLQQVGAD